MTNTELDFLSAVSDLRSSNITKATLDIMRRMVEQGLSSRLMEQATLVEADQDEYKLIVGIQRSLEAMAQFDCPLACILMSDLWSLAGSVHEVSDGIGLWLVDDNCNSVDLERHLRRLASSDHDPGIRKYFQEICEVKYGKL